MKLHAVYRVAGDRGDERVAVVGDAEDVLVTLGDRREGVHVIEGTALAQLTCERRGVREADLVPADVRQLQRGRTQRLHGAGEDPQSVRTAVLCGALEQQLQPEAHPQQRCGRRDALAQQLVESPLAEVLHGAREGANAGDDETVGGAQRLWVAAHHCAHADVLQRLLHRAAVAHAVVHHPDRAGLPARAAHVVSVPFVLGIPLSLGSLATASRRPRANALQAASIMWCALLPASTRTCRVSFAALASARKNSSVSSCSNPPVAPGGSCASNEVNGRPDTSMAQLARDSSMGTVAEPKREMPERSPSARSSAWPRAIAQSSAVWCAPVCRSPSTTTSRSMRAWRASRSSMWSRKPTPVLPGPAPVPSSAAQRRTCVSAVLRSIVALRAGIRTPDCLLRAPPSNARATRIPRHAQWVHPP